MTGKHFLKIFLPIIVILILAAAAVLFLTAGRTHRINVSKIAEGFKLNEPDPVMLVDYCRETVAAVDGDGYSETVLYQNRDGSCEIRYYGKEESDEPEIREIWQVDPAAAEAVYEIINRNQIALWNDRYPDSGLDGARYVLRFRDENGAYIEASSDNMPEDGIRILTGIAKCMDGYAEAARSENKQLDP